MLCAEECILRMSGSPMDECDCLFVQLEDPYLEIILNTKETLPNFHEKLCDKDLLGDLSPMRLSRPEMGRDKNSIWNLNHILVLLKVTIFQKRTKGLQG